MPFNWVTFHVKSGKVHRIYSILLLYHTFYKKSIIKLDFVDRFEPIDGILDSFLDRARLKTEFTGGFGVGKVGVRSESIE